MLSCNWEKSNGSLPAEPWSLEEDDDEGWAAAALPPFFLERVELTEKLRGCGICEFASWCSVFGDGCC